LQHVELLNELIPIADIRRKNLQNFINAKGGETIIEILTPNKKEYKISAKCSKKDSFARKVGISICLGRFLKELLETSPAEVPDLFQDTVVYES
jgi:hypothetical protein